MKFLHRWKVGEIIIENFSSSHSTTNEFYVLSLKVGLNFRSPWGLMKLRALLTLITADVIQVSACLD